MQCVKVYNVIYWDFVWPCVSVGVKWCMDSDYRGPIIYAGTFRKLFCNSGLRLYPRIFRFVVVFLFFLFTLYFAQTLRNCFHKILMCLAQTDRMEADLTEHGMQASVMFCHIKKSSYSEDGVSFQDCHNS